MGRDGVEAAAKLGSTLLPIVLAAVAEGTGGETSGICARLFLVKSSLGGATSAEVGVAICVSSLGWGTAGGAVFSVGIGTATGTGAGTEVGSGSAGFWLGAGAGAGFSDTGAGAGAAGFFCGGGTAGLANNDAQPFLVPSGAAGVSLAVDTVSEGAASAAGVAFVAGTESVIGVISAGRDGFSVRVPLA